MMTTILSHDPKNFTLDLLRGLAILLVIAVHSSQAIIGLSNGITYVTSFGQMGCQLFILITGFSLCISWQKQKNGNLWQFYKRRFISIAPGYYITLFFFLILNTLCEIYDLPIFFHSKRDFFSITANILFIHGLFPSCNNNVVPGGWYIGTTAIFYVIFPLCGMIFQWLSMKCRKVIYFFPLFILIILAGIQSLLLETSSVWKANAHINGFSYYHILTQMPVLLMGMTLFYLYLTLKNQRIARYQLGFIFLISAGIAGYTLHHPIYLGYILHPFLAACAFASLFLLLDSFANKNGTDIPCLFHA